MKAFKDWNISSKLGFVFTLLLILVGGNFFSVNYFKSYDQLENDLLLQKTAENPLLIEKLNSINRLFIYNGDTSKIEEFKNLISKHQVNVDIFEFGGEAIYLDNEIQCDPVPMEDSSAFVLLKNYWEEYKGHLENVTSNKQFILSIAQFRRWNHLLNQILKTKVISEKVNLELYQLQVLVNEYLLRDPNLKDDILAKTEWLDAYIKSRNTASSSELKQVWSSLSFHIKFIANRSSQVESIHYVEQNAPYLINLEILFKDEVNAYILKRKISNHANLVIAMAVIVLLNLVFIGLGFSIVKQFIVIPVKAMDEVASSIARGEDNVKFKKLYDDEIGNTIDRLNNMLNSLEKLNKEKEVAERALSYRNDFLANMSHEIRTPLMGIIGMVDVLIQSKDLTEDQRYYINTLKASSGVLLNTLNEILDFSKLEEGQMSVHPVVVNIHDAIYEVCQLFQPKALESSNELEVSISDDVQKFIKVDVYRLKQVLSNLVGNALKFTSDGLVQVHVALEETRSREVSILFEVKDEGIGIPKEEQETIFDQFTQVQSIAHKKIPGTGLGLSISKLIVELLGGEIGLISEEGKGCTFWFTINCEIVDEQELKAYRQEKEEKDIQIVPLNKHILLAEDNKVNQMVLGLMLDKLSCTYDIANNGQETIDIYEERKYDLIITDVRMPIMGGEESIELLRKKYSDLCPVVCLSANVLKEEDKNDSSVMDHYLFKPVEIHELYNLLKEVFSH